VTGSAGAPPSGSAGRFAPSPTGDLHLGNLRTALAAWTSARANDAAFVVRMEDLDRVTSSVEHEHSQLADLAAIGITSDRAILRQSERFGRYHEAIAELTAAGLTYECWCSRREIREAVTAPHGTSAVSRYPGTCRDLSNRDRRAKGAEGRPPAIRLRADRVEISFVDSIAGPVTGAADDAVLRRNDGVPAYQLAVVVDDAAQGIDEVVRGDDLLGSTPTQIVIGRLLGLATPRFVHVPLVVTAEGERLAKRHGAVTLRELGARGIDAATVRQRLLESLEHPGPMIYRPEEW
jgi:glutamyl-tRNA synthetase